MLFSLYNLIDCSKGKDTWVLAATLLLTLDNLLSLFMPSFFSPVKDIHTYIHTQNDSETNIQLLKMSKGKHNFIYKYFTSARFTSVMNL